MNTIMVKTVTTAVVVGAGVTAAVLYNMDMAGEAVAVAVVGAAAVGSWLAYLGDKKIVQEYYDVVPWSKAPMASSLNELASYYNPSIYSISIIRGKIIAGEYPVRIKGIPHSNGGMVFSLEIQPEQSLICSFSYNHYHKSFSRSVERALEQIVDAENNNRKVIVGGYFTRRGETSGLEVRYVQDRDHSFGYRSYLALKKSGLRILKGEHKGLLDF